MTQSEIFTISGRGFRVYYPGYGSIAAMQYAMKRAFFDLNQRHPGIPAQDSTPEVPIWDVEPDVEFEQWKEDYSGHPRVEFRIAEALLIPVDLKQPFTEEVYYTADPMEVGKALGFITQNLLTSKDSPDASSPVSKKRGTSKASTK